MKIATALILKNHTLQVFEGTCLHVEDFVRSQWDVLHVLFYSCNKKRLIHLRRFVGSSYTFLKRIFKSMFILLATVNCSYDCEILYH